MVRDIEARDVQDIQVIHEKTGFDYNMPDLLVDPLVLVKKVYVDSSGKVVAAAICRIEAETMLWLDPDTPTEEKVEVMAELNVAICQDAYLEGLDTLTCRLPPGIEDKFQKRLKLMGWERNRPCWSEWGRRLKGNERLS